MGATLKGNNLLPIRQIRSVKIDLFSRVSLSREAHTLENMSGKHGGVPIHLKVNGYNFRGSNSFIFIFGANH